MDPASRRGSSGSRGVARVRYHGAVSTGGTWRAAIRGNVLAVGVVSFLTDLSSEMIHPLLPAFVAGLVPGGAALVLGLMAGVSEATASLIKLGSGVVSDRLGRRKPLVLLGYGLSTLARPAMAWALVGWHVVALKFVDRVGKGIRTSPRDALIADAVAAEHRGLAFSFHRAMDHAGAVLGPLLALVLLQGAMGEAFWSPATGTPSAGEMAALRDVFKIALVPGLLAVLVVVFAVRDVPAEEVKPAARAEGSALPRSFWRLVAASTLFALGNSSDLFLLLYAQERFGYGLPGLLGLWVGLHLVKMAASVPGGLLADRVGRRAAILAGWGIYAGVYLGLAVADRAWQLWGLLLVYGIYYGLTEGSAKALVADLTAKDQRATAFGLFHGVTGLAALPASVVFGAWWVAYGSAAAFSLGAGLAVAAIVVLAPRDRGA